MVNNTFVTNTYCIILTLHMASSKEETLARMLEKIALKHSDKECSNLDSVKTTVKVEKKVVDGKTQDKIPSNKESVDHGKPSNVNADDKSFSTSSFEEGESSKDNEGTFLFLNLYTIFCHLNCLTHI